MNKFLILISFVIVSNSAWCQTKTYIRDRDADEVTSIVRAVDADSSMSAAEKSAFRKYIEENQRLNKELEDLGIKTVSIGVSIGPRFVIQDFHEYSIANDTLVRDALSSSSFVLSTSLNVFPLSESKWLKNRKAYWEDEAKKGSKKYTLRLAALGLLRNIGIMANVNLVDFSTDESELSFNRTIDGGIGVGYRLSKKVYIAYNWDWFTIRQPRQYYIDQLNQPITLDGNVLESLEDSNEQVFRNVTGRARAVRVIIAF